MSKLLLSTAGALALLTTAASAAPLSPSTIAPGVSNGAEQVRLVCNPYGRCYRTGPRYVDGYYGGYGPRYGYGYGYGPRYGGYGYGGPGVTFSFGNRW